MVINVILVLLVTHFLFAICSRYISQKRLKDNGNVLLPLTRVKTDAIKGIAIIIIMLAHLCQYEKQFEDLVIGGEISRNIIFSFGAVGVSVFFFLSGYGCYHSINATEGKIKWLIIRVGKLLIRFIICFLIVILINSFVFGEEYELSQLIDSMVFLHMPNTSSWYFRVQLLLYVFIFFSTILFKENAPYVTLVITMLYAIVAHYFLGLPDYWWMTCMCFPVGSIVAMHKRQYYTLQKNAVFWLFIIAIGLLSWKYLLSDETRFWFLLFEFISISFMIVSVLDRIIYETRIYRFMSKRSFELYLVHIGIVQLIFKTDMSVNNKMFCYIIVSILAASIAYFIGNNTIRRIHFLKQRLESGRGGS